KRGTEGRDWTQYVITGPDGESEPLRKRQAILTMVTTLRAAGVPASEIAEAIPPSRFVSVDGTLDGTDLREAFALTYPKGDPGRWFMENPIHNEGRTWIVTKMWGRNTEPVLERLTKLAPEQSGIGYEAVPSCLHCGDGIAGPHAQSSAEAASAWVRTKLSEFRP